jgi:hypothetical protein
MVFVLLNPCEEPSRMRSVQEPREPAVPQDVRWLARAAMAAIALSVTLMLLVGLAGPSAAVPTMPGTSGWPPYVGHLALPDVLATFLTWGIVLIGGAGLGAGLAAVRRGWRPRNLIIGSILAVVALTLVPPIGSTDMLDYAVYGRIAALDHSPYRITPAELRRSADPIGAIAPVPWEHDPSVYGPLATITEKAASELGGTSAGLTLFWLKVWSGIAYLAIVAVLDRLLRSEAGRRARAHLLWSVNPLMLLAVTAGGHVDGLAAAAGVAGLLALRRMDVRSGLLAGLLAGAAVAVKAPLVLFGFGLVWAAYRSPRVLAAVGAGATIVLVPSYLLGGGRPALVAQVKRGTAGVDLYQPWQLLYRALDWHDPSQRTDLLGAITAVLLAALLLWCLPEGPPELPAIRPSLALSLAWLVTSPQQRPWFDAMIFPLLAVMPATRLDWIALGRAVAGGVAELPGVTFYTLLRPPWLAQADDAVARDLAPLALLAIAVALIWLCITRRWLSGLSAAARPPRAGCSQAKATEQAPGRST